MKSYKLKRKNEISDASNVEFALKYLRVYINKQPLQGKTPTASMSSLPLLVLVHLGIFRGTSTLTPKSCMNVLNAKRVLLFNSDFVAHNRKHINDNDYVCMTVNCGKRFKRDSELKAHVKAHRKTNIRCGHTGCTYSNKDIP